MFADQFHTSKGPSIECPEVWDYRLPTVSRSDHDSPPRDQYQRWKSRPCAHKPLGAQDTECNSCHIEFLSLCTPIQNWGYCTLRKQGS